MRYDSCLWHSKRIEQMRESLAIENIIKTKAHDARIGDGESRLADTLVRKGSQRSLVPEHRWVAVLIHPVKFTDNCGLVRICGPEEVHSIGVRGIKGIRNFYLQVRNLKTKLNHGPAGYRFAAVFGAWIGCLGDLECATSPGAPVDSRDRFLKCFSLKAIVPQVGVGNGKPMGQVESAQAARYALYKIDHPHTACRADDWVIQYVPHNMSRACCMGTGSRGDMDHGGVGLRNLKSICDGGRGVAKNPIGVQQRGAANHAQRPFRNR